jgi:hypothetical protein
MHIPTRNLFFTFHYNRRLLEWKNHEIFRGTYKDFLGYQSLANRLEIFCSRLLLSQHACMAAKSPIRACPLLPVGGQIFCGDGRVDMDTVEDFSPTFCLIWWSDQHHLPENHGRYCKWEVYHESKASLPWLQLNSNLLYRSACFVLLQLRRQWSSFRLDTGYECLYEAIWLSRRQI